MSDGPYRTLPMSPNWKKVAKSAYLPSFAAAEIVEALQHAAERDCRAELSPGFIRKVSALVIGPDAPTLFERLPLAELNAMHRECASPMEASFLRNTISALNEGLCRADALQKASEDTVSDRLLAGHRQVEEHIYRTAPYHRARETRFRLETAHSQVDVAAVAKIALRLPDAPARQPSMKYSGLDDGVSL